LGFALSWLQGFGGYRAKSDGNKQAFLTKRTRKMASDIALVNSGCSQPAMKRDPCGGFVLGSKTTMIPRDAAEPIQADRRNPVWRD
jgi:hypothetical protein